MYAASVYVSFEGSLCFTRLRQLVDTYAARYAWATPQAVLSRIFIEHSLDRETQMKILLSRLPKLLDTDPSISLVVVDSIAALFRGAQDEPESGPRANELFLLASALKSMSEEFGVPLLVINQVSEFSENWNGEAQAVVGGKLDYERHAAFVSSGRKLLPALGLAWASCVNCCLHVSRHHVRPTNNKLSSLPSPHFSSSGRDNLSSAPSPLLPISLSFSPTPPTPPSIWPTTHANAHTDEAKKGLSRDRG